MKRLLFMVQLPPPLHGAATVNQMTVQAEPILKRFQVDVIPMSFNRSFDDIFEPYQIRKFVRLGTVWGNLVRKCLLEKPDILVVTLALDATALIRDVVFLNTARALGVRQIVIQLHGTNLKKRADKSSLIHKLYQNAFENTDVILLSDLLYEDVSAYVDKSRVWVVPNGIEEPVIKPIQEQDDCRDRAVQLLYLSSLMRLKGPLVLLDALTLLKSRVTGFHVTFAGPFIEEGLEEEFYELVQQHGLEAWISVVGPVYGEEKGRAYENADIFILPTLNECFPLVLLEAAAYGLPAVASLEGGISDIIDDGETGLLTEMGNPEDLAQKLECLIRDEQTRESMGRAARLKFAQKYTKANYELNMSEALRGIAASHQ